MTTIVSKKGILNISKKISIISGLVILLTFTLTSVVFLYFESGLVDKILDKYVSGVEKTIDEQVVIQKTALEKRLNTNIAVFAKISSSFLYNIEPESLKPVLITFMELDEIKAIKVNDNNNTPFLAAWKKPDIETGTKVPESIFLKEELSKTADCSYESYGSKQLVGYVKIYFSDELMIDQLDKNKKKALDTISLFSDSVNTSLKKSVLFQIVTILFAVALLVITIVLCLKFIVINPVAGIIKSLSQGIQNINASSQQISSGGQNLAKATSEQAASMEEISSSMEEISSMTRQNADHSDSAKMVMNETEKVVLSANNSLKNVTVCMEEIGKAGEETGKIIKSIDEIAFQTNLLALNAAVEAARAGETGAGFAVVADEVRNLAIRSAHASETTTKLIEGTITKVNQGLDLISMTNKDFEEVVKSAARAKELINNISSASSEQARGIDQVTETITQVSSITQQNAATAEESAGASQELFSQAEVMNSEVDKLTVLIGSEKG